MEELPTPDKTFQRLAITFIFGTLFGIALGMLILQQPREATPGENPRTESYVVIPTAPSSTPSLQPVAESELVVTLGQADQFPPNSVTELELPIAFYDPDSRDYSPRSSRVPTWPPLTRVSPVPIYLVRDEGAGFIALYRRDPFMSCNVQWIETTERFLDPCYGSKYTRTGEYIEGPAPRDLDRFEVILKEDGLLEISMSTFHIGLSHPRPSE